MKFGALINDDMKQRYRQLSWKKGEILRKGDFGPGGEEGTPIFIENMALHFKKKSGERFSLGQKQAAEITFEFAEDLEKQAFEYRIKLKRSCAPTAKADEGGKVK